MKQLVILSGKGGTGKTSLSAALAQLAAAEMNVTLVDADADAANLALLLDAHGGERHEFIGGKIAVIDPVLCKGCGECVEICRFDALELGVPTKVIELACEGCGSCSAICPVEAIRMEDVVAGHWTVSDSSAGRLFHARLVAGMENSGKLVSELRRRAADEAKESGGDLILIDGPPGIGCPVHAAVTGADLALLVTEPSLSALHDLERALDTVAGFGIPARVVLNKVDLSPPLAERVREFCRQRDLSILGEIPFLEEIQIAVEAGKSMTHVEDAELQAQLKAVWISLKSLTTDTSGEDRILLKKQ